MALIIASLVSLAMLPQSPADVDVEKPPPSAITGPGDQETPPATQPRGAIFLSLPCWGDPATLTPCLFDYKYLPPPRELFQPSSRDKAGLRFINTSAPGYENPPGLHWPKRNIRVLYYTTWAEYATSDRISAVSGIGYRAGDGRFSVREVLAAAQHPHLDVRLWGPGFPNYDPAISLLSNIARKGLPGFDYKHLPDIVYSVGVALMDRFPDESVQIQATGGCRDRLTTAELAALVGKPDSSCAGETVRHAQFADVLTFRSASEVFEDYSWERLDAVGLTRPMLWAHDPDCEDPTVMYPLPFSQPRQYPVQLFGYSPGDSSAGTLETAVAEAITSGMLDGVIFQDQPSLANPPVSTLQHLPPGTVDPSDPFLAHVQNPTSHLPSSLRSSILCVIPGRLLTLRPRLFTAALLSACVVVTDAPPTRIPEWLNGASYIVPKKWSSERVVWEIEQLLDRVDEMARLASEGFSRARRDLTCQVKVDRMLNLVAGVRKGDVGHLFMEGFAAGCGIGDSWCPEGFEVEEEEDEERRKSESSTAPGGTSQARDSENDPLTSATF
ncbi:hypothetical protein HDU93_001619 [Gonapodya sp. JEL0774]|nr:hypothetical protein HDU93_001619 [Gonapodya sp. JEL0774]